MNDFAQFVDLASERLGGEVLEANDEFFAPKENLLKASKPVYIEGKYTARGKWMDGWETRRRRTPGYDWCVTRLGLPGRVRGAVVDTSFFKGNYPEQISLEGCDLGGSAPYTEEKQRLKSTALKWVELIPQSAVKGDSQNCFSAGSSDRVTHVRLKIYPDGGVARLRVHGEVTPAEERMARGIFDLAAIENGGRIVATSDQFFSEPLNLLMSGRSKGMNDGWETRRRRGPGHDWAIVKLGVSGVIRRIEVDTSHFKGNFPESCSIEACYIEQAAGDAALESAQWQPVLAKTPLKADRRHIFRDQLKVSGPPTHVRLNIYPDGGVARLRIFGRAERPEDRLKGIERFNQISAAAARQALEDCCGSKRWAEQVLGLRPFESNVKLIEAAEQAFGKLHRRDWLEAFRHHPPIGGKKSKAKQSSTARRWSAGEQSAAQKAQPEMLAVLAAANQAYEAAFGYAFLICATGKTGEEILKELQQRLGNDPEIELRVAAEEQKKIARLRLEKLLES
ncbi:MAG TPA: allantoicase [Candidatus Limnocylindrales bacterium]|nr:allantoicase [Candidatus Limnocylindrales bacterium]